MKRLGSLKYIQPQMHQTKRHEVEHDRDTKNPEFLVTLPVPEDPSTLTEIIRESNNFVLQGKFEEYLHILSRISQKILDHYPTIRLYQAAAMLFSEYPREQIEEVIAKVEKSDIQHQLHGEVIAIQALIQSYTGDPELGIRLSEKALPLIAPQNAIFRNLIVRNLGIAFTIKNDLRNADDWLEKLLMSSLQLKDWGGVLAAYNYLTFVRKIQGRFSEAGVIYKKALEFISIHNLDMKPHGIKILAGYANLLLQWHRIPEAKAYCQKAIRYAKQTDILYAQSAYQHLIEAFLQENDMANALAVLRKLRQSSVGRDDLYHQIHQKHTQSVEARIHLAAGRIESAQGWLESIGFNQIAPDLLLSRYGYELGYILPIATQVYLASGMADHAIAILNTTIPKFMHQDAGSHLIRALVALSVVYHTTGLDQKAIKALLRAIELAAPENNIGDFTIMGSHLLPLLYKMKKAHFSTDFSNELLLILSNGNFAGSSPGIRSVGVTPLSTREMDVLSLIAQGLTNREIGVSLFLSANTIKSHSINIYRKLNVKNRNQAVSKARLLGILPGNRPGYPHDLKTLPN